MSTFLVRAVILSTLLAATFLAPSARAEQWLVDGEAGLGIGIEGGDGGDGKLAWRRARTRLVLGADMGSDEATQNALGFRGFLEIEERGSLGAELRYVRWLSPGHIGIYGGFIGTVAPETLAGIGAGGTFILRGDGGPGLFIQPSLSVLPLGSDLTGDSLLVWALVSAGVRLSL